MTDVHVGDGRIAKIDADAGDHVVGEVAASIARTHLGDVAVDGQDANEDAGIEARDASVFSLKVDGIVLDPDDALDAATLAEADSVELVDVTNHEWPSDAPSKEVPAPVLELEDEEDDELEDDD